MGFEILGFGVDRVFIWSWGVRRWRGWEAGGWGLRGLGLDHRLLCPVAPTS